MQDTQCVEWGDDDGSDRDLLKAILRERLDEIRVTSASWQRLQRLERLGLPLFPGATLMSWAGSASGDDAPRSAQLPSGVTWNDTQRRFEVRERYLTDELTDWLCLPQMRSATVLAELNVENDAIFRKAGFVPMQVQYTAMLRPGLARSRLPAFERTLLISREDVERFGAQSGDMNPVHFDDDFARGVGFEGRITHGMIFSGWLTKLLGQEYPGPGTIFLRSNMVFVAPIYPGMPHVVRVSTPEHDPEKKSYRIVAQVFDEAGKHCVIAYSDVIHRIAKP